MSADRFRLIVQSKSFFVVACVVAQFGCAHPTLPVSRYELASVGYFDYRLPEPEMGGVVIGALHGRTDAGSVRLARLISGRTGAAFVTADGFQSRQINVDAPPLQANRNQPPVGASLPRHSVIAEFKQILGRTVRGNFDWYIGIRRLPAAASAEPIQLLASGLTAEQAVIIKQSYVSARDRIIGSRRVEKLPMTIDPLEGLSRPVSRLAHHGVLLTARKGLDLQIPEKFLTEANVSVYGEILAAWLTDIARLDRDHYRLVPRVEVTMMDHGRFDWIASRAGIVGVAIGAPHGSYDEFTGEIATRLGFRTGLATVVARGFTPTEAEGWRINVNRPSEKSYLAPEFEVSSARAQKTFQTFSRIVRDAAGGDLRLYFDLHQYGVDHMIQIATVGVDSGQALRIKQAYRRIRDRLAGVDPEVDKVELLIEPLDKVEIGAWPAKYNGILSVARKSLHIELPLHSALRNAKNREFYTEVLSELIEFTQRELGD